MDSADQNARVLVFAPIGRDAQASAELLRRAEVESAVCRDLKHLILAMDEGVGAVLIGEEGLFGQDLSALIDRVEHQPAWSDLPFIILTSHQEQPAVISWREKLVGALRNVSLLERPVQPITLASAARSALRARARQYEVRSLFESRDRAAELLERMVAERTQALEEANSKLRSEMVERIRAEETLRQAQKIEAIGQLTGGVAHDFNNLLTVIIGGLQVLDRQRDPKRRQLLMDGMHRAAQRGAGLTRQLLAFSRRQELRPEPVDIARQIGGMRELLGRSLRGDVHVEFAFPDALWPVEIDPGELELVVLNLAVNARDAMPNGGTIKVGAENVPAVRDGELHGDYVRLTIADTGIGMSPEVQARVFEPFFTTKEVGSGSGLGLAQVYGFATQSGGAVSVDLEVGLGTRIILYLPRSNRTPLADQRHPADLHVGREKEGSAGDVLLVEDDQEVAALVSEMLDQLGFRVTRAGSAASALGALANDRQVDVVLSDIMMPGGMNGVELALEIRARRRRLPILLTSGYAEAARRDAETNGIPILPKPYRLEDLAAALASISKQT